MNQKIADGPLEKNNPITEDHKGNQLEKIKLYEYQRNAVDWLKAREFGLLSLCMGLGKSAVSITASDELECSKILVICPAILRANWEAEFEKFSKNNRIIAVYNSAMITDMSVVSYEFAAKYFEKLKRDWDVVICDESHYMKNPATIRAKNILGAKGLVQSAKRIWFLSGTPVPNGPHELWTTLFLFGRTKLKYQQFVNEFCETKPNPWGAPMISGAKIAMIPFIKEMLRPVMYRKTKEDVMLELPPISYHDLIVEPVSLTIDQMEYDEGFFSYMYPQDRTKELLEKLKAEAQFLMALDKHNSIRSIDGMKMLEAMAQSISTLRKYVGIQKAVQVLDLVKNELENRAYKKIVIFAIHKSVIEYLHYHLKKYDALTLYGGTPEKKRQRHISSFQDPKSKYRVLICNVNAGGIGINLTNCTEVLMLETSFTPSVNFQAIKRCHRIGQTNKVRVRFVSLKDSIDQKVVRILKRKVEEIDLLLQGKINEMDSKSEANLKIPKPEEDLL
jgi:SNF2 family DNA or RNA helicase